MSHVAGEGELRGWRKGDRGEKEGRREGEKKCRNEWKIMQFTPAPPSHSRATEEIDGLTEDKCKWTATWTCNTVLVSMEREAIAHSRRAPLLPRR